MAWQEAWLLILFLTFWGYSDGTSITPNSGLGSFRARQAPYTVYYFSGLEISRGKINLALANALDSWLHVTII